MITRCRTAWALHSKTILGLIAGTAIIAISRWLWPDGGADFDVATIVGAIMLGFGLQGVLDYWCTEVAKPEE